MRALLSFTTVCLWLIAASLLPAQGLSDICNSAPRPGSSVSVNGDAVGSALDCADSLHSDQLAVRTYYSTTNQASWVERQMSLIGSPGYANTWETSFPDPTSGTVFYYVNADDGEHYATQAPYNSGNAWPPGENLLARVAEDDTGDANNPEGPFLDLTGAWLGYSADRFYVRLTNNDDEWPTSGGLLRWYAYSLGFSNPAAPSDSWTFALIFVDAWPVMQHGLFAVNRYTGDIPGRVGDIDRETDGNRLTMRCRIGDLTGDRRFGPWPNSQGWLYAAALTQTITTGGATVRDTTNYGLFYGSRTPRFVVGQNQAPTLANPRVFPRTGTPETQFRFQARYADTDTNLPLVRAVVVDADTLSMFPDHHRYWDGPTFTAYRQGFARGWHVFRFLFDDGMGVVASAPDSFQVTGTGIPEYGDPGELSVLSNPFRRMATFAISRSSAGLDIHRSDGRVVMRLERSPGSALIAWNGRDRQGNPVPAGVYYARTAGSRGRPLRVVRVE